MDSFNSLLTQINARHSCPVEIIDTEEKVILFKNIIGNNSTASASSGNFGYRVRQTDFKANKYDIFINTYSKSYTPTNSAATLGHEYGHYLITTRVYNNLPYRIRKYIYLKSDVPEAEDRELQIQFIKLWEELAAWFIAWYLLLSNGDLKPAHITHGLHCYSTYIDVFFVSLITRNSGLYFFIPMCLILISCIAYSLANIISGL